jgi:hypothetical protein
VKKKFFENVVENYSKDRFLLENDGEKSFENKNFFFGPYVALQNQQNFGTQISIAFIWYFQYKISKCFFCNMMLIYVVYINKKKKGHKCKKKTAIYRNRVPENR